MKPRNFPSKRKRRRDRAQWRLSHGEIDLEAGRKKSVPCPEAPPWVLDTKFRLGRDAYNDYLDGELE